MPPTSAEPISFDASRVSSPVIEGDDGNDNKIRRFTSPLRRAGDQRLLNRDSILPGTMLCKTPLLPRLCQRNKSRDKRKRRRNALARPRSLTEWTPWLGRLSEASSWNAGLKTGSYKKKKKKGKGTKKKKTQRRARGE